MDGWDGMGCLSHFNEIVNYFHITVVSFAYTHREEIKRDEKNSKVAFKVMIFLNLPRKQTNWSEEGSGFGP